MQIASTMAGFTLGQSDILRRAVSKKKKDVLDEEKSHFVSGALQQGYSEKQQRPYMNISKNLQTMDSIGHMHLLIHSWDSKWRI